MKKLFEINCCAAIVLFLLISLASPAFAAEVGSATPLAAPTFAEKLFSKMAEDLPFAILFFALVFLVLFAITITAMKLISLQNFRKQIQKFMSQNAVYVDFTGIPPKQILDHFYEVTGGRPRAQSVQRRFLEELYSFFLTQKSIELAALDETNEKTQNHFTIRAQIHRRRLADNYSYQDFLDLKPLEAGASK